MQKERGTRIIAIVALCLAVAGISIAYATMNTTLTIKGNAVMETAKWEIKLDNLQTSTSGAGELTTVPEIVDDIKIETFSAKLTKPGDAIILKFDVQNNGSLDANVSSAILGNLTCASALETPVESDATLVCNNLKYTLTYTNDTTASQTNSVIAAGTNVTANQKLLKNQTVNMTLKLEYTGSSLPSGNVNITIGDTTILFEQA